MKIAGRQNEITRIEELILSKNSEFLAIYGRRRIGKTYLIREVYAKQIVFECAGLHEKDLAQQLENFGLALHEVDVSSNSIPKTWLQAFAQLKTYLNSLPATKKVIFLDEISWFDTPRSGFLAALDNFWNQYCTKRNDIILVICGSAASWIINKVINNRGGLHNRITQHIALQPFTLSETKAFLEMNNVNLNLKDIAQLYMCLGGVPYYMKDIKAGQSVPQILDNLFFNAQASLKNEFSNLYASLFTNNQMHVAVVKALAQKNKGLTRNEIIEATGFRSGGGLSVILEELVQCGFMTIVYPLKTTKENMLFKLTDEFSLFYFKFLANQKGENSWLFLSNTQSFKIWSGLAFENLCFKHIGQIKKALGISGIVANQYSWFVKDKAQIDLLIDRSDNCINILEIKFYNGIYELSKSYAERLREKVTIFKEETQTKKNVFVTLLTIFGTKRNEHYLSNITNELTIDDLFS